MGWSLSGQPKSSLFVGCHFCFKGNEWLLKKVPTQDTCEKCDNKGGRDEEDVFGVAREMEFFKCCLDQGVDQGVKHIKSIADNPGVHQTWKLEYTSPESGESDGRSQNEPSKKERF